MWRVVALALFLASCTGEAPMLAPADTEAARVKITAVGPVAYLTDLVLVPVALQNEGGPGFYKVRFYGAQSQVNAPPDWEVETELVGVVERGYRASVNFHVRGTGASPLVGISVFSRGLNSEHFTRWHVHVTN